MNRQERRAAASEARRKQAWKNIEAPPRAHTEEEWRQEAKEEALCPCCNVRRIMLQIMNNQPEFTEGGESFGVAYAFGNAEYEVAVADFGVLKIELDMKDHSFAVRCFGEVVFSFSPDPGGMDMAKPGPWIYLLGALNAHLAHRFGPARLPGEHLH